MLAPDSLRSPLKLDVRRHQGILSPVKRLLEHPAQLIASGCLLMLLLVAGFLLLFRPTVEYAYVDVTDLKESFPSTGMWFTIGSGVLFAVIALCAIVRWRRARGCS